MYKVLLTVMMVLSLVGTSQAAPTRRGCMVLPATMTDSSISTLRSWKVNLVRWQLVGAPTGSDLNEYFVWLDLELAKLQSALPKLKANGIRVVVDLHSAPGGVRILSNGTAKHLLFESDIYKQAFLQAWRVISDRLKTFDNTFIYGYDLLNEPAVGTSVNGAVLLEGAQLWRNLSKVTYDLIRSLEAGRRVIIESSYGDPQALTLVRPLQNTTAVEYSIHMYYPINYTHQGLLGIPIGANAPTLDRIKNHLQPVVDYVNTHGIRLYVGEFSVANYALNAHIYLRDVTSVFELNGWNYTYHAFREADVWNLEVGDSRRLQVMLNRFSLNL
jgi:endoglucanase